MAPNAQAAVELAFYGRSFYKPSGNFSSDPFRYDGEKYKLFLQEVANEDKIWHLNLYYGFLLSNGNIGAAYPYKAGTSDDFTGTAWDGDNFTASTTAANTNKAEAKKAYEAAVKFFTLLDKTYDKTKKSEWDTDKIELAKFETAATSAPTTPEGRLGTLWASEITAHKTQSDNDVKDDPTDPGDNGKTKPADIDAARDASGVKTDKAKKIFDEVAKKKSPLPTKEVLTELKTLAKLLEEIHSGTKKHDAAYSELNGYKTGSADKKAAWAIADEVDDGGKGYATTALEKLTNELKTAKNSAKSELGDEAYNTMGIDSKNKVQEINDIKELFGKAKQAWDLSGKTDTTYETLFSALEGAQNSAAWTEVNKYQKDKEGGACSEGYAAEALKRLKGFKEQSDKGTTKMRAATTPEEVKTVWEALPDSEKSQISLETVKRIQALKKLTGDKEEKELGQALGEKNDTTEFSETSDSDYEKINKFIEVLKKFKGKKAKSDGSPEEKILQKLKDIEGYEEPETLISNWLTRLEERQKVLHQKYMERHPEDKNNPNQNPETSFWKSPLAIVGYCILGVVLVGGVAWLILRWGEEEVE